MDFGFKRFWSLVASSASGTFPLTHKVLSLRHHNTVFNTLTATFRAVRSPIPVASIDKRPGVRVYSSSSRHSLICDAFLLKNSIVCLLYPHGLNGTWCNIYGHGDSQLYYCQNTMILQRSLCVLGSMRHTAAGKKWSTRHM